MKVNFEKIQDVLEASDAYAAMIYGSYAREEDFEDVDIAVFTEGNVDEIVREAPGIFDIQRFSDLPMYIAKKALEDGELFYCIDEDRYYDETIDFVRRYEDFRPRYQEYMKGVKARG